ncbi:hypothetical protein DFH09DRAFT_1099266 [Mycena vulgaris]|nr:hypothetical protein DFH09DRAFT_1099266 [Mycena vulgaris]
MFNAIPTTSTNSGVLVQQMLAFKRDHTIFDEECRPPTFRRDRSSHVPPTESIPAVVNDAPKRKEERKGRGITASKPKGEDGTDEEKPTKRTRTHQRKAQEGASKRTTKSHLEVNHSAHSCGKQVVSTIGQWGAKKKKKNGAKMSKK